MVVSELTLPERRVVLVVAVVYLSSVLWRRPISTPHTISNGSAHLLSLTCGVAPSLAKSVARLERLGQTARLQALPASGKARGRLELRTAQHRRAAWEACPGHGGPASNL